MTACRSAFLVLAMCLMSGCTPRGPKTPAEASGEYVLPNPAKKIDPPRQMASNSAHWDPPTGNVDARLLVSEEFHYVFLRVKNRSEGARLLEQASRTKQ